jgi:hypothetical protein
VRIPVLDNATVATEGALAPTGGLGQIRANTGWENALGSLGRGVAKTGALIAGAVDRYNDEANALAEGQAELEWQTRAQRMLYGDPSSSADAAPGGGYYDTRGNDALKEARRAADELDKARDELANSLTDEKTRNRFLQKTGMERLNYRRGIEEHASKEADNARKATAQGLVDIHLGQSEAGVLDFDAWKMSKDNAVEHVRALAPTQEAGDAAVAKFLSADAEAFAKGLITQGKVEQAKAFVEEQRQTLGSRFAETQHAVEVKLDAGKKDVLNAQVAGMVAQWADEARGPDGFVTEDALRLKAQQLPPADPRRDELDAALEKQVHFERARLDATTKKYKATAELAALVDRRPIPAEAEQFLRQYDPEALVSIREKQRAESRRWKTEKDGSARERADARRAQGDADKVFLNELETELAHNPQADPKDFEKAWISRRTTEGEDVTTPSEVARSKAGLNSAKAVKAGDKSDNTERRQLASRLERTIAAASKVKGKTLDQTQLNERVGRALTLADQRAAEKGKPLDEKDLAQLEADLMRTVVTAPGWWGTGIKQKTAPLVDTVDAGTPPPAPAKGEPVKMRFPDGTTADVPAEKVEKAMKKGGQRVE